MVNIGVIIPAAGCSTRFGNRNKLAEDLGGRPMLLRTVEFFTKREDVTEIIVVGPQDSFADFQDKFAPALSFHGVTIAKGGLHRCDSVANGLRHISEGLDRVAIHDGARPALTNILFDRLVLASKEFDAVAPAIRISGTIKKTNKTPERVGDEDAIADSILGTSSQTKVDAYEVKETIDRTDVWELQRPEMFCPSLILNAYCKLGDSNCTDDSEVLEKQGQPVFLIEGESRNIKVTTPSDFNLIKAILGVRGEKDRQAHKRF